MKVLLVHNEYQNPGGEDTVMRAETEALRRAGDDVETWVKTNHDIQSGGPVRNVSLAVRTVWNRESYNELTSRLAAFRPDVVHFHNTFPLVSPAAYDACFDAGIPVVQTLHNFRLICPAATLYRDGKLCDRCVGGSLAHSVMNACYRGSRATTAATAAMIGIHRLRNTWERKVNRYIALTEYARDMFVRGGLPPEKIEIKPNFLPEDPGYRPGPRHQVAFVGRLTPEKGLHTLLAAWKQLPEIPLVIAGDGALREELEAFTRDAGMTHVRFLGHLGRKEILSVIGASRFLVFPSEWPEGLPMTIAESFGCGVPVVCSAIGGLPEIVQEGKTGLHFRPGDAGELAARAASLWRSPNALDAMSHAARARYLSEFTASRHYERISAIYAGVIRGDRMPVAQEIEQQKVAHA